jgi:hypothetical protein
MSYTNADGLYIRTRVDEGEPLLQGGSAESARQTLVVDIPAFTAIGSSFGSSNINPLHPVIPAGSVIVGATLVMSTAADSAADNATLTIGTYNAAGTAIDADGIDATIAQTAIDAEGDVVRCDGAQASGVLGYVSADAYIGMIYGTAAYTAGAGKLIVEYVKIN